MDWKTATYSLGWLRMNAVRYDRPMSIVSWLRDIGIMPEGLDWKRRNSSPKSLDELAIPGGYLAEVALSWDDDGHTTPLEFVENALEFETKGTMKSQTVADLLGNLGWEPA